MQLSKPSPGLFFSHGDLALARENQEREPLRSALALLSSTPDDPLDAAHLCALRYQFFNNVADGQAALDLLRDNAFLDAEQADLPAIKRELGWLSVVALLRDHPAWQPLQGDFFAALVTKLNDYQQRGEQGDNLRLFWLGALQLAAGILLESDEHFQRGAQVYRAAVDQYIHPEGYLRGIVDIAGAGQRYQCQVSGVCALVLMAEMAGQVGIDLWSYNNRAVTPITAATYAFYYYFFPEKWRWEEGLNRQDTVSIMRREGAFMEMVNRQHHLHEIERFFAEQRPLFSAYGGGLTTLTHGIARPKKKRWSLW